MHMSVRSDRFPRMRQHWQALGIHNRIRAFERGKNKGTKPLAERRRHWLSIRKDGNDVVVRLYNTDIIRYKSDNTIIVRQGGWSTSTTHETIGAILGTTVYRSKCKDWIRCGDNTYLLRANADNLFNTEDGGLTPINPTYPQIHLLNREEYKKARAPYLPFIKYAVGATKLRGSCEVSMSEHIEAFGAWQSSTDEKIGAEYMADESQWYRALLFIYQRCNRFAEVPEKEVKEQITRVIKRVHRDTVFVTKEVRDGREVADSNREFFG